MLMFALRRVQIYKKWLITSPHKAVTVVYILPLQINTNDRR